MFIYFRYVSYWRQKFKTTSLDNVIPSVLMTDTGKKYYLISTLLKDDKELRHKLKLNYALEIQEAERNDKSFTRLCLFCKLSFEGLYLNCC